MTGGVQWEGATAGVLMINDYSAPALEGLGGCRAGARTPLRGVPFSVAELPESQLTRRGRVRAVGKARSSFAVSRGPSSKSGLGHCISSL